MTRQALDDDFPFGFRRDVHRNDLVGEVPGFVRCRRAAMAFECERILLFARHAELGCDLVALRRHRHREVLIPQTVVNHRIDQRAVAEAIAEARVAQQVGRVRHRFHSAGRNHCVRTGVDRAHRIHDGEQSGRAHFVDRVGGHRFGQARLEHDLTRRILPDAGLQNFAEDHVLDFRRIDAGALDRTGESDGAERGGGKGSEGAAELAERGAGRREHDGL